MNLSETPDISDVFLVFRINKTLVADKDAWIGDYLHSEKDVRKVRDKLDKTKTSKDTDALKRKYKDNCNQMYKYK